MVLAGRTDHRVVLLLAEDLLGLIGPLAPQVGGVDELHLGVVAVDLQPHRSLGLMQHHQNVDPGALHPVGVAAAASGVADAPGERALADHREAVGLRRDRAVEGAGREDQRIVGPERVDPRLGAIVQQTCAVAFAADVELGSILIERLESEGAGGEIHLEHAPGVSFDHRVPP